MELSGQFMLYTKAGAQVFIRSNALYVYNMLALEHHGSKYPAGHSIGASRKFKTIYSKLKFKIRNKEAKFRDKIQKVPKFKLKIKI